MEKPQYIALHLLIPNSNAEMCPNEIDREYAFQTEWMALIGDDGKWNNERYRLNRRWNHMLDFWSIWIIFWMMNLHHQYLCRLVGILCLASTCNFLLVFCFCFLIHFIYNKLSKWSIILLGSEFFPFKAKYHRACAIKVDKISCSKTLISLDVIEWNFILYV